MRAIHGQNIKTQIILYKAIVQLVILNLRIVQDIAKTDSGTKVFSLPLNVLTGYKINVVLDSITPICASGLSVKDIKITLYIE
jgi:hypothetical protein